MKFLKKLALSVMILLAVSITVSATTIEFTIEEHDKANEVYAIVATIKDGGRFAAFKSDMTFDYSVIIPVSAKTGAVANIAGGSVKTPVVPASYYDENNEDDVPATLPQNPQWTINGTKATMGLEEGIVGVKLDASNFVAFKMTFKYAEGKSEADLGEDALVIDYIKYVDHDLGTVVYDKTKTDNELKIDNKVAKSAPAGLTVPAQAGDAIILQDGTAVTAEATGDYTLPSNENGLVSVAGNVYVVKDGAVTYSETLTNGVSTDGAASLRKDSAATGLRFESKFVTAIKADVKEYGYIITVESSKVNLATDTLDLDLVAAGKAKKGIGYDATTDIYWDIDGANTIVTAVANGIPLTKKGVTTNVAARPYYILSNGTVIYGATTTRQAYEVAVQIKANDATTYAKYKDYVDAIIALVPTELVNEVELDLGPLF